MSNFKNSSIGKKYAMALSAFFLLIFLLQHFMINFTSVISEKTFNEVSHFFGTNPLIQFVMQPILMFAVIYHFVMGIVLELENRKARPIKYQVNGSKYNTTWVSRNMIWSGLAILAFLVLHLIDFFFPEMQYKYICHYPDDPTRYYPELVHKFQNLPRVIAYCVAFVFLGLHLAHGFQSAFQSVGANHAKYTPLFKLFGKIYAIVIPLGFIFIALYHYFNH